MTHPNQDRLQAFLNAYGARDRKLVEEALAEEAVWHVGGTHQFSGDYRGREAILDYFDRTGTETADSLRLEPVELMADDRHGAVRGLQLGRRRSRVPWIYSVYHVRMRRPAAAQPDGQWAVGNGQAVPMNPGR